MGWLRILGIPREVLGGAQKKSGGAPRWDLGEAHSVDIPTLESTTGSTRIERRINSRKQSSKHNSPQVVQPLDKDSISSAASANTPYYGLIPIVGSVTTGTFTTSSITNPTRGALNYMRWTINRFTSDQTYEHDFFLLKDSTSPGAYFARSFSLTPWCQPKSIYAATSWPSSSYPFIDSDLESTGLCSSSGWIAFSLGAAQANAITTNVDHYTVILMPDGDATTDKFLLQGQVGYQYPLGSRSALNSYPYGYGENETTHYGLIKNGNIPGSQSWTFNGNVPDTPINILAKTPTSSSIKLNFTDITWDETNIIVERSKGGSTGPWTTYDFGVLNNGYNVGNWIWVNTGLSSKTKYCYRVKAINLKGSSSYSNTSCNTTI